MQYQITTLILSTFGSASLLAAAFWLARTWISERLTQSIKLETDKKLAKFQSDLSATHKTISDLTSYSHSTSQEFDLALLPYRIEAIKTLMHAANEWQKVYAATSMIHIFDSEFLKKSGASEGAKKIIEQLLSGINIPEFLSQQNKALLAQPFVSSTAWALYYAYHTYYSNTLVKANLLTISGIDHGEALSRINEDALVKKSSPQEIYDEYKNNRYLGASTYLKYLYDQMMMEFKNSLSGQRASDESLIHNVEIIKAATNLVLNGSNEEIKAHTSIDMPTAQNAP